MRAEKTNTGSTHALGNEFYELAARAVRKRRHTDFASYGPSCGKWVVVVTFRP